jgi:hypothetical protein
VFDPLNQIPSLSPVGPGQPVPAGPLPAPVAVPQFNPEAQSFPAEPPEVTAARVAAEQQNNLRPGQLLNVPPEAFAMPGGFEQPAPPSVVAVRNGLRRGRNLTPIQQGEQNAITPGQEIPVIQREGVGGQIQNNGPDRVVTPTIQESSDQTGSGNQLLSPAPGQEAVDVLPSMDEIADAISRRPEDFHSIINEEGSYYLFYPGVPNGLAITPEGFAQLKSQLLGLGVDIQPNEFGKRINQQPASPPAVGQSELPAIQPSVRPDDILDFIANNIGKIKGKKSATTGTEGYYSEAYKGLLRRAAVRNLFTNKGGQSPDEVVASLRDAGYLPQDASVDDLWDIMDAAAEKRKNFRAQEKGFNQEIENQARQHDEFNQIAFQPRMVSSPVPTADLLIGDEFSIGGEKFTVKNMDVDPDTGHVLMIEAEDGKRFGTQRFSGDRVLNADKNSYKPNEDSTEFLPKSDREMTAGEITALDQQINELKAKEKLTPDEFRQLELLEQKRGQKFMELNDPRRIAEEQQQQAIEGQARQRAAAPPVTQQDMFGQAEPGQEQMFSIRPGQQSGPALNDHAQGIQGIHALLDRVKNHLPANTYKTIKAFLDMPVMQHLDWSKLQLELTDTLSRPEAVGSSSSINKLIKLTSQAPSATFAHEVGHILYDFLPVQEKAALEQARLEGLAKFPPQIQERLKNGLSSQEFIDQIGSQNALYRYSNPSEFYAHLMEDEVAKRAFESRHGKPLLNRLVNWFKSMVNGIKRAFGNKPSVNDIIDRSLAGKYGMTAAVDAKSDEQLSFRRTSDSAQNAAALVRTPEEQQVEGETQTAQSTNLLDILVKHGAAAASSATQKALRFLDLAGIKVTGERMAGPGNYQVVKGNNSGSPTRQKVAALATASQVRLLEATLDDAIQKKQEAVDQLARPAFQNKIARLGNLKNEATNTEAINKASTSIFESAYRMAQRALRQESRNDVGVARLQAQLNEIDEARRSSSAMSILVNDFVNVLSSTPEGQAILSNPDATRAEMIRVYRDLKRSAQQPTYNDSLLNWAAFILTRNKELSDDLWARQLARNSTIRSQMGAYGTKLAADLERNPAGTVMREIRSGKNLQRKEDLARFAYRTLNKDVMAEMDAAGQKIEAGQIAEQVKADPDFTAFRKEVYDDANVEGRLESFTPGKDETFFMPDGKTSVDISMNGMKGNKVPTERWAQWEKARDDLKDWLTNNPDHPDYGVHEKNLQNLEEFYYNETVHSPHDREHIFADGLNTIMDAVRNAGGRFGAVVSKMVPKYSRLKGQAGDWSRHWSQEFVNQRLKTLKSHGLKWKGVGGSMPKEVVNGNFVRQHLNQVLYSLNRPAGALKVGDKTQSGLQVTREDLNDAKLQHDATKAGFKVIEDNFGQDNFVIDNRTGFVIQRKPGKTSEDMVPRILTQDGQQFVQDFKDARDEYRAADGDPAKQAAATRKQIDLINQNWDRVAYPYLWDRNPNFAQQTPFDGPGMAYEQIAERMQNNPNAINNFDELLNELVARSAMTKQEAQEILLADMGNMFEDGLKKEESNLITTPITGEKKNAFTRARGAEVLPYSFYQYGFGDSTDVHKFSGAIHSRAVEQLLNGLNNLKKDLEGRKVEFEKRSNQVGTENALKERAQQKANGDNYDSWTNLDDRLAAVQAVINYMTQSEPETKGNKVLARIVSGVQGSLVGNVMTTERNVLAGPKYAASMFMRLNGRGLFEYPQAVFYIQMLQAMGKRIPSLAKALAFGSLKTIPGLKRAAMAFANNKGSRVRSFLGEAAHDWLRETGTELYRRQKDISEMEARGLDYVHDNALEFKNKLGAGFLAGGELLKNEVTGKMNKLGQSVGAGIELLNTPLKGMLSAMGEHALNAGIVRMMDGKLGHRRILERALNRVFDRIQSGARGYDFDNASNPANKLAFNEIFGKKDARLFSSADDLETMEAMYQDAGLSAQTEFWRYLKQRKDGVRNPRYLGDQSANLLTEYMLGGLNKPTAMQQAIALQGRHWGKTLVRPLLGWNTRTLNTLNRLASIPSRTPGQNATPKDLLKARVKQILAFAGTFLLPALVAFSLNGLTEMAGARQIAKHVWGQEMAGRYPWERDGVKSQALGWVINATYGIPFLDMIINSAVNDMPARASLDPNLVMINKAKDLINYVGGVIQTGDPTFGLTRFIEGVYPDSRAILNRLESETGKRAGADVVALLRRNGPQDLLKPTGGPVAGALYTELSPYGQRLENAALNEDWGKFKDTFKEAVDKARELGKADPEKLVRQIFEARNPFTRALKEKMTNGQYTDFLDKLSSEDRNKVEQVTSAFTHAGNLIETQPTFTKEQRADRSTGSSGGFSAPALSRAKSLGRVGVAASAVGLGALKGANLRSSRLRLGRARTGRSLRLRRARRV